MSSAGGGDAFVCKYSPAGDQAWCHQFGTEGYEGVSDLNVDRAGVYVAGDTGGAFPGQTYAGGETDEFLCKYESTGSQSWCFQYGTAGYEWIYQITSLGTSIYTAGGTIGAYPGETNTGVGDAVIVRISVKTTAEAIEEIIEQILDLNLTTGIENGLDSILEAAGGALSDISEQNNAAAIGQLTAFNNAVEAQRGVLISDEEAEELIAQAREIIEELGG